MPVSEDGEAASRQSDEGITVGTEARDERCRGVSMTFSPITNRNQRGSVRPTFNRSNQVGVIAESVKAGCR